MLEQSHDGIEWPCHHVCTDLGAIDDVHGMSHRSGKDLGLVIVIVKNGPDLRDQSQAVGGNIVQPSYKGRYIGSTCLGSQDRLSGREHQGHIDLDTFVREVFACLDPICSHRKFHYDLRVERRKGLPFLDHTFKIS